MSKMANEKRLIYIDDAVKKLKQELDTECEPETDNDSVFERFIKRVIPKLIRDVINWLEKQPTVDAVEVVRCKDCKHTGNYGGYLTCPYYDDLAVEENHFCSYGERRSKEE